MPCHPEEHCYRPQVSKHVETPDSESWQGLGERMVAVGREASAVLERLLCLREEMREREDLSAYSSTAVVHLGAGMPAGRDGPAGLRSQLSDRILHRLLLSDSHRYWCRNQCPGSCEKAQSRTRFPEALSLASFGSKARSLPAGRRETKSEEM